MADDPLHSFRQRLTPRAHAPVTPELVVNHPGGREPYLAFGAKDKVTRLDIRCRHGGLAHAVGYNYLLNLTYNRHTYGEIFLTVSGLTVMIKGRALRPIVDAIKLHNCEFVQEFDPEEFSVPEGQDLPYIDSIVVEIMRGTAPGTGNSSATS